MSDDINTSSAKHRDDSYAIFILIYQLKMLLICYQKWYVFSGQQLEIVGKALIFSQRNISIRNQAGDIELAMARIFKSIEKKGSANLY